MAQLLVFVRGNKIITRAAWLVPADETGVPTDPAAVVFTAREHREPAGTAYTYLTDTEVTRASQGVFELALIHDTAGTFHVHAQGAGAAHGAGEITYKITESGALEVLS